MENLCLSEPPNYLYNFVYHENICRFQHPYTKWMRNMIRSGSVYRVTMMMQERPELFHFHYQIPDQPELMSNHNHDNIVMFNRMAVLYLTPLSLAIYMKCDKMAQVILQSGIDNANSKSYATDVFSKSCQTPNVAGDVLEISPICIAIRRECFEIIPYLYQKSSAKSSIVVESSNNNNNDVINNNNNNANANANVRSEIILKYQNNRNLNKDYHYHDCLHYAIETLKKRGNFPLSRFLHTLMTQCQHFTESQHVLDFYRGQACSTFRRLACLAYFEDPSCRMSLSLIQGMHALLKMHSIPWKQDFPIDRDTMLTRLTSDCAENNDQEFSLLILLGLYERIQKKIKNGPLDYIGYLIYRTLAHTLWLEPFLKHTPEELLNIFACIDYVQLNCELLQVVQNHIQGNLERDFDIDLLTNLSGITRISEMKPTVVVKKLKNNSHISGFSPLRTSATTTAASGGATATTPASPGATTGAAGVVVSKKNYGIINKDSLKENHQQHQSSLIVNNNNNSSNEQLQRYSRHQLRRNLHSFTLLQQHPTNRPSSKSRGRSSSLIRNSTNSSGNNNNNNNHHQNGKMINYRFEKKCELLKKFESRPQAAIVTSGMTSSSSTASTTTTATATTTSTGTRGIVLDSSSKDHECSSCIDSFSCLPNSEFNNNRVKINSGRFPNSEHHRNSSESTVLGNSSLSLASTTLNSLGGGGRCNSRGRNYSSRTASPAISSNSSFNKSSSSSRCRYQSLTRHNLNQSGQETIGLSPCADWWK